MEHANNEFRPNRGARGARLDEGLDAGLYEGFNARFHAKLDAGLDATPNAQLDAELDAQLDAELDAKFDAGLNNVHKLQHRFKARLDNVECIPFWWIIRRQELSRLLQISQRYNA